MAIHLEDPLIHCSQEIADDEDGSEDWELGCKDLLDGGSSDNGDNLDHVIAMEGLGSKCYGRDGCSETGKDESDATEDYSAGRHALDNGDDGARVLEDDNQHDDGEENSESGSKSTIEAEAGESSKGGEARLKALARRRGHRWP